MLSPWAEPFDQVVYDILKYRHVQLIPDFLSIPFSEDQIRFTQD
ncbi:MAG TPA: hypothetical protein VIF83_02230 [Gemmatimonadaceae bacterium]|jgi:hypothetical protein